MFIKTKKYIFPGDAINLLRSNFQTSIVCSLANSIENFILGNPKLNRANYDLLMVSSMSRSWMTSSTP